MTKPIITLTTDFGTADHYVGTVKGVLLHHCREASLVDISHQVPPYSILAGAYTIGQAWSFFPSQTVHLVVVDPGVGTERRAIVAQTDDHLFVAPDNGVLSIVLSGRDYQAFHIAKTPALSYATSQTFHGRDVFAVIAAQLASTSLQPSDVGPSITPEIFDCQETDEGGEWRGLVLSIDRFGNIITNFEQQHHKLLPSTPFHLHAGASIVERFCPTFGVAPPGMLFAYFGSSGFVEIGMNRASAADALNIREGDRISLRIGAR